MRDYLRKAQRKHQNPLRQVIRTPKIRARKLSPEPRPENLQRRLKRLRGKPGEGLDAQRLKEEIGQFLSCLVRSHQNNS